MKKVHIFCAGGTIDKIYFDAKSDYQIGEPAVIKMLEAVKACEQELIIITHGTDTMPETARSLAGVTNKTIVLTGAMAPAIFRDTDALFNVGCALAAVQSAEQGVYIAMNGELFDGLNVRKDVANERFVAID